MKTAIQFEHVSKFFGTKQIIKDCHLSLQEGEVVAIVGPSGCGKTTFLHLATNVLQPTSGHITCITDKLGYVFQEPRLLPWCTLYENVTFSCNGVVDRSQIMNLLARVKLDNEMDAFPKQLSGGMKQRVSIVRAFACKPKLIMMDEPFSALDYWIKKELVQDLIDLIENEQVGMFYVTHDYEEAATVADRIINIAYANEGIYKEIVLDTPRKHRNFDYIKNIEYQLLQL
ncbi:MULTISPECIES: ABC transporter ATP-binding protein [Lysinibacillus]|jgi:ABC-type nitrate/sulfonate/bicarbonate transport system ATPase subunit|uniref:ABC transporter domain-containing protein n=1 Tax=Lysinibacillus fusiformis TaxID=28031 RepID=A0A2I0UVR3_9BACI|nr:MULTISPECIES: ATP-binding cassette domain-containing protein [Lysinibacillus]KUF35031.1 hypothetical protein AK833_08720 [Lysinibacillus sp. F5]MEE3807850.1 ATP-binding cassette domain-containing protein [Lysinibacillus fusiformis]PKU50131.1 hypothetical protein CRI88_20060 [Lysinibacillus fusiformis]WCH48087.1 ATP-binding cassette domain-containing protein [Lysinibacillus sp. OF-1]SCY55987.1 NitT/TauT family transport system ATP-binding protein [Lysinibacillus sp. SG9]